MMNKPHEHFDYSRIVVHGMNFHTDDILCVTLARMLNPNIEVVRTNDADEIAAYLNDPGTIVADIGRGYFDHHQEDSVMSERDGHKLCAAGIIYQTYGKEIPMNERIRNVFECLLSQIDRQDNFGNFHQLDKMNDCFLPNWNEPSTPEDYTKRFMEVSDGILKILSANEMNDLSKDEFYDCHTAYYGEFRENLSEVTSDSTFTLFETAFELDPKSVLDYIKKQTEYEKEYYVAQDIAREKIRELCKADKSKDVLTKSNNFLNNRVLVMDECIPQDYLRETGYMFIVYPSNRGGWNIQTVEGAVHGSSRIPIDPIVEKYPECTFRHISGFLANFTTKEAAIEHAERLVARHYMKDPEMDFDKTLRQYFGSDSPQKQASNKRIMDAISLATIDYAKYHMSLATDSYFGSTSKSPDEIFNEITNSWVFYALESKIPDDYGYATEIVADRLCELGLSGKFQRYSTYDCVDIGEPLPKNLQLDDSIGYISISEYQNEEARELWEQGLYDVEKDAADDFGEINE